MLSSFRGFRSFQAKHISQDMVYKVSPSVEKSDSKEMSSHDSLYINGRTLQTSSMNTYVSIITLSYDVRSLSFISRKTMMEKTISHVTRISSSFYIFQDITLHCKNYIGSWKIFPSVKVINRPVHRNRNSHEVQRNIKSGLRY